LHLVAYAHEKDKEPGQAMNGNRQGYRGQAARIIVFANPAVKPGIAGAADVWIKLRHDRMALELTPSP
jgi:hypothetical protein